MLRVGQWASGSRAGLGVQCSGTDLAGFEFLLHCAHQGSINFAGVTATPAKFARQEAFLESQRGAKQL